MWSKEEHLVDASTTSSSVSQYITINIHILVYSVQRMYIFNPEMVGVQVYRMFTVTYSCIYLSLVYIYLGSLGTSMLVQQGARR